MSITKREFKEFEKKYQKDKKRWEAIKLGDTIYDVQQRGGWEFDYHEMKVLEIDVDIRIVKVLDLSVKPNEEKEVRYFDTQEEAEKANYGRVG